MTKVDRCLRQIQAVRDVAVGNDPPYVARSRIGRLCESTVCLVETALHIENRQRPGKIRTSEIRCRNVAQVAECSNRVFDLSRHLRQPSEPLDERWRRGWEDLLTEMEVLERRLDLLRH